VTRDRALPDFRPS